MSAVTAEMTAMLSVNRPCRGLPGFIRVTERGESIFAVYHATQSHTNPAPLAVLLCSAFGAEDLSAHRGWRGLAQQLAEAGLPCLCFDWPGQGDSYAPPAEDDLLPTWIEAGHAALRWLQQTSGASRVALVGLRMGALLAQELAARRDDVHALVMLAPPRSGPAYVRELKMLASSTQMAASPVGSGEAPIGTAQPRTWRAGAIQAAGFVLNAATVDSLKRLPSHTTLPVAWVTWIDRADRPVGSQILDVLEVPAGGVKHYGCLDGFVQMFVTPYLAKPPDAVYEQVQRELLASAASLQAGLPIPRQALPPAMLATHTLSAVEGRSVCETVAVDIGAARLQGVWTEPMAGEARTGQAVLVLNSSAERRIGPNGMWVQFARVRAARGDVVLRLDFPGIGESDAAKHEPGHVVYPAQAMRYVADALQAIHARSPGARITLLGLCSGAYHAFRAVVEGLPVDRAFMINPLLLRIAPGEVLNFEVQGGQARAIADKAVQRMRDPQRWIKLLKGQVDWRSVMGSVLRSRWDRVISAVKRWARDLHLIPHLPLTLDLRKAISSKTHLHFIFAQSDPGAALVREQTGRVYDRLLKKHVITEAIFPGADHTFSDGVTRQSMLNDVHHALDQDRPSDSVLATGWYASAFR